MYFIFFLLHALVNLANVVFGATTQFIGERSERSEPKIWHGSLVNLENLVNASEHYLVLDMNVGWITKSLTPNVHFNPTPLILKDQFPCHITM